MPSIIGSLGEKKTALLALCDAQRAPSAAPYHSPSVFLRVHLRLISGRQHHAEADFAAQHGVLGFSPNNASRCRDRVGRGAQQVGVHADHVVDAVQVRDGVADEFGHGDGCIVSFAQILSFAFQGEVQGFLRGLVEADAAKDIPEAALTVCWASI
jgi:hypothetical protein